MGVQTTTKAPISHPPSLLSNNTPKEPLGVSSTNIFESGLDKPPLPSTDTFNYVFHAGRRAYPWHKVIYRVDGTNETLSLAQLEEKSRRFAVAIRKQYNIKPNDVVSIFAKNRIEYPIALFGSLAAGATIALIPYQHGMSSEDIGARLEQAKSKLLVTDSALLTLSEASSVLVGCVPIVTMDRADEHTMCLGDLLKSFPADQSVFQLDSHEGAEELDAFINRTSGSTGAMKSVVTSHSHYIAALEGTVRTVPANTDPNYDTWLASSSLGFMINAKLFMSLNILLGIPVVIMPEPLDETSVSVIKRHAITFILVFPPLVAKLAKAGFDPKGVISIKWLLSAGATIPDNLRQAMSEKFPGIDLTLEWGTSETMLIAIQTDEPKSRRRGSSGILVNGMQARVISTETGADLGPNKCGELLVRNSLARFQGYKDNEEANRDFDADGWFHTGDYGYIDEDRNVYIIDRLKELLRVGDGYGSRISVTDLENAVFEHPAVQTVVVVGLWSDATSTHHPTAFVILSAHYKESAGKALAEDIEAFASRKLTGLRKLTGGVYFIDAYPTTGFKINRRALKEMKKDSENRCVIKDSDELFQTVE
ncbi:AMP-binding enzyme domain protein [Phaeosphaeriaceae sp. PMI808]|nr:AMP-binding enzyme domain protein [Phaeosphaeriaceae sp. PMI808]